MATTTTENVDFGCCDVCGGQHETERCPELGLDEANYGQEQSTPEFTKARLSLATNLAVAEQMDGTVRVVATMPIPSKTRFGPMEAMRTTVDINIVNGFVLKIFNKDQAVTLDTSDENNCNWMCLVQAAAETAEQNLMAFQIGTDIFYHTIRDVRVGEELKVWYAPGYAKKLGKPSEPNGTTKNLVSLQTEWANTLSELKFDQAKTLAVPGVETETVEGVVVMEEETGEVPEDPNAVGASPSLSLSKLAETQGAHECRRCNATFLDKAALARHLQNHLRNYICEPCDEGFFTKVSYERHRKLFHKSGRGPGRPSKRSLPYTGAKRGRKPKEIKVEIIVAEEAPEINPEDLPSCRFADAAVPITITNLAGEGDVAAIEAAEATAALNVVAEAASVAMATPATPTRTHRYSTRGIVLDTAKLAGVRMKTSIKEEPIDEPETIQNDDDPDFVVAFPTPKTPMSTGKRGRKRRSSVLVKREAEVIAQVHKEVIEQDNEIEGDGEDEEEGGENGKNSAEKEIRVSQKLAAFDQEKNGLPAINRKELTLKWKNEEEGFLCYVSEGGTEYFCCISCDRFFSQEMIVRLHISAAHDPFCGYCKEVFAEKDGVTGHHCKAMLKDILQNEDGTFSCPDCSKLFKTKENLEPHLLGHRKNFTCDHCKRSFMRKDSLISHMCPVTTDEPEKAFHCDLCSASFTMAKYLFRHLAGHAGTYRCTKCDRNFSRKQSMMQHLNKCNPQQAEEMGMELHPCKDCNKVFTDALKLRNHLVLHEGKFRCEDCLRTFSTKMTMAAHQCLALPEDGLVEDAPPPEDGERSFNCQECDKSFTTERYLERHMTVHDGRWRCQHCMKCFSRHHDLINHAIICRGRVEIQVNGSVTCEHCPEQFTEITAFQKHVTAHESPYKCLKCSKSYKTSLTLESHLKICQRKEQDGDCLTCDVCQKSFRDSRYLVRHQQLHESPQYHCETCGKSFFRKDYYNYHTCKRPDGTTVRIRRKTGVPAEAEPHICHHCGKTYCSIGNLNKHLKRHGEKTCACGHCGKRFHLESSLKEHIKHVHLNHKKLNCQCPQCGKLLKSKNTLYAHLRQFHTDNIILYNCGTCGKTFRQKGNLHKHQLMHSDARTYICKYCGKAFKYPEQLNRHLTEHEQGRQYECDVCHKTFVKEYDLRKHNQVFHSGMTYTCQFCLTDCRHVHTMRRHIRRRHPDKVNLLSDPAYIQGLQHQMDANSVPRQHRERVGMTVEKVIEAQTEETGVMEATQVTVTESGEVIQVGTGDGTTQTVSIEYLSQEAAEVLQSLSAGSEVQTVSLAELSQFAQETGNTVTHIVQEDAESQEYILVPLITQE